MKYPLLLGFFAFFLFSCGISEEQQLQSPSGLIRVEINLKEGTPHYALQKNDEKLILPSPLSLAFKDFSIGENARLVAVRNWEEEEPWDAVWGEKSKFLAHYKGKLLTYEEENGLQFQLEFRAYDDGIGFRYIIPEQEGLPDSLFLLNEKTFFQLPEDYTAWWIEGNYDTYELLYTKSPVSAIGEVENEFNTHTHSIGGFPKNSAHTPLTMKTSQGSYLSIHEAALIDYAGMTLERLDGYRLKSNLVPWPDGILVRSAGALTSPWRAIIVADSPGELVESELILSLNTPRDRSKNYSYIEPMNYVGIWWSMHLGIETWGMEGGRHGATTENTKRYIDFAAANNIRGVLVEGWNTGWESWYQDDNFDFQTPYPDFDLEEVARYAQEKGVALIGHHETGGQVLSYEENLEAALDLYQSLGIKAIKTGYAGQMRPEGHFHQGQFMVRHHQRVVDEAAKRGIMVNIHEPIKDTGLRRTYPNLMTREGVRGMEWNAWSRGNPPSHTPTLVFTRMLAGPLDYTPGIFDLKFENFREQMTLWNELDGLETEGRMYSTLARQLAHYVLLYSPLQMAADMIENYEDQPAFEFIRQVPADWDEIRVLDGEIGEYVIIARRKGEQWFLGGITDEQERQVEVPLDFLGPRSFMATSYADTADTDMDENPTAIAIETREVNSRQSLVFTMKPGGGFAVQFTP